MPNRLWITPANDLEALTIAELLAEHGENYLVTRQPWGASWANLEPALKIEIDRFRQDYPEGPIYGIELAGPAYASAINIDHHIYKDEDRSHPKSSLEQVAGILQVPLTRRQELIAANDAGWIPALKSAGASQEQIDEIRRADRAAQGLSAEAEAAAQNDVEDARKLATHIELECSIKPNTAHTDFLYGKSDQILLKHPSQWIYSGPRHKFLADLKLPEKYWSGGKDDNGYFGIEGPSKSSQEKIMSVIIHPVHTTHLDTILYFPLRLDSCGELCSERNNPDTSPNEWLDQCADWITRACPAWTRDDKPSNDLAERTNAYQEFCYFHPFVHDLFPLKGPHTKLAETDPQDPSKKKLRPSLTLIRTDITHLRLLLSKYNPSNEIHLDNPAGTLAAHPNTITLAVKRIDLTIILTDVAILRVHLQSKEHCDLHTTMSLLNEVRRLYAPHWTDWDKASPYANRKDRTPGGQVPLFAQWTPSPPHTVSDSTKKAFFLDNAEARQSPILFPHWRHIVYPLQPDIPAKQPPEGLKFNLLGDDRCFLAASIRVDDYPAINDAEWMRLAFVDEGGGGWAYNEKFLDTNETRQKHFYDRFHHWGTRYLVTDYSFLQVIGKDAPGFLDMHLRRHYNTFCLLALMQKYSILTLSHRLAETLARFVNSDRAYRDKYHSQCRKLASDLSTYVALYDFAEVSSQLQATELFGMLRERMRIKTLFEELKQQTEFTINEEGKNYEEYIQKALRFFIPASLAAAILGFSYGFDQFSKLYFDKPPSTNPLDVLITILIFFTPMVLAFLFAQGLFFAGKWWFGRKS
jgi:hypothetical protein